MFDEDDNCPSAANPEQEDLDEDGEGDGGDADDSLACTSCLAWLENRLRQARLKSSLRLPAPEQAKSGRLI